MPEYQFRVIPEEVVSLEERYATNFPEVVSEDEKATIFTPVIERMSEFFEENGRSLPNNMLSRLHLLNGDDFLDVCERESMTIYGVPLGDAFCIGETKTCFVDMSAISDAAQRLDCPRNDLVRSVGAHELAHSPTYTEVWIVPDLSSKDRYYKRHGLTTGDPLELYGPPISKQGTSVLDEGIAETFKREVLRRAGFPDPNPIYHDNVFHVSKLTEKVGIGPLFRATYTEEGLEELKSILDLAFFENFFTKITEFIGSEHAENTRRAIKRAIQG